ncbi:beta-mannosidase [Evansella caseinilytica]|uniref:Beta-mannosidase n=1 Tax=Evansella caseinilytica TaxID=1503961 RepID=A0A1H3PEM0_9BACI|nr:glycoside hydrolase family 2 protein [Evansella caseinilytica]SDY99546.1 beta-mannosidase [Evansella caseinilytica]
MRWKEVHRRHKPYCMGTLYWQMNDRWPVASWSSLEYDGRWKALHYRAKESLKDVAVSFERDGNALKVYLISDHRKTETGELVIRLYELNGSLLEEALFDVTVPNNQSEVAATVHLTDWLANYEPAKVVVSAELTVNDRHIDEKYYYFVCTKDMDPPKATVKVKGTDEPHQFKISADAFAKQVWLATEEEGYFTANFFDLLPGKEKMVRFIPRHPASESKITVTAASMVDMV